MNKNNYTIGLDKGKDKDQLLLSVYKYENKEFVFLLSETLKINQDYQNKKFSLTQ